MDASKHFDDLIAGLKDWRGEELARIRAIFKDTDPDIIEEWKWRGAPVWSNNGIICVGGAFKDKIKLTFFNGAKLNDPDKLFNNGFNGNKWRAIDIHKEDNINELALKDLIQDAIKFNYQKK